MSQSPIDDFSERTIMRYRQGWKALNRLLHEYVDTSLQQRHGKAERSEHSVKSEIATDMGDVSVMVKDSPGAVVHVSADQNVSNSIQTSINELGCELPEFIDAVSDALGGNGDAVVKKQLGRVSDSLQEIDSIQSPQEAHLAEII